MNRQPGVAGASPPKVTDGRSPLWRAHNVFRIVTLCYAWMWFLVQFTHFDNPALGWVGIAVMTVWTPLTIWKYRHRQGRTNALVFVDQIVVTLVAGSSEIVLSEAQMSGGMPTVTTLWHSSMITAAAIQWGMFGGGVSGFVASVTHVGMRGYFWDDSIPMDTLLMLGAGLLLGLAADSARASTERLTRALRAEASTAERERLARSIHDSVLQVLAHVRRRGSELGGEAADLARLAGEQEVALRAMVAAAPAESTEDGDVDLASKLQVLSTATAQVSVPATAVFLPKRCTQELLALAREALGNVERHAGPDARAWVLLEDLGAEVVLSIRDNGPGIPPGRLDEAASEGRMGVAQSIRGRVTDLGGTITLDTGPGQGTEWEVRVPRTTPPAAPSEHRAGGEPISIWRRKGVARR